MRIGADRDYKHRVNRWLPRFPRRLRSLVSRAHVSSARGHDSNVSPLSRRTLRARAWLKVLMDERPVV